MQPRKKQDPERDLDPSGMKFSFAPAGKEPRPEKDDLAEGKGNNKWIVEKKVINVNYGLVAAYRNEHSNSRADFLPTF